MRLKAMFLAAAALAALTSTEAKAQLYGGTVVTGGPGFMTFGTSSILTPGISPVATGPYTVIAPTSRVVIANPAFVGAPAPVIIPRAYPVVRPGWGPRHYGPVGPGPWGRGWRRW